MEKSSKLQKSKRSRSKYVYTLPEKGVLYTEKGDPITLGERDKYVCGGCLLLLRTLGVRSWLRSPLLETHQTQPLQVIPFARSKCDCDLSFLMRNPSLFQNSPPRDEYIFMAFSLTCRCLSEIRAKVDGLLPWVTSVEPVSSQEFGVRVTWMRSKLMDLQHWLITYQNT